MNAASERDRDKYDWRGIDYTASAFWLAFLRGLVALLEEAEEDVLAYMAFPQEHCGSSAPPTPWSGRTGLSTVGALFSLDCNSLPVARNCYEILLLPDRSGFRGHCTPD